LDAKAAKLKYEAKKRTFFYPVYSRFLITARFIANFSGRYISKDAFDRIKFLQDNEQTSDNENQTGDHHFLGV
jgi:hypothetical protein